eukprot:631357-Amphidinium_carterae.1
MADMPEMSRAVRALTKNTIPWAPANCCATFTSEVTLEKLDQVINFPTVYFSSMTLRCVEGTPL